MNERTFNLFRGIIFSFIMGVPVVVSIVEKSGEMMVMSYIFAVVLVIGVAFKEVEIGNWFYANFFESSYPDKLKTDGSEDSQSEDN